MQKQQPKQTPHPRTKPRIHDLPTMRRNNKKMKLHMVTVKKRFNLGNYENIDIEASAYATTATETIKDIAKKLDQEISAYHYEYYLMYGLE